MKRFAIILLAIVAGCSGQSTAPNGSTPPGRNNAPQLSETTIGGIVLQPTTVVNGKLSLLMPQQFSIMDDATLRVKYPNDKRPTLVYTNESGSINVAINHTKDRMPTNELGAFQKYMDGLFRKQYPSATWFKSGVIDIHGRKWLNLELRTPAVDTNIRNIMVGTSVKGRLFLVSFNVTEEQEDEWLRPAEAIVQSLYIND